MASVIQKKNDGLNLLAVPGDAATAASAVISKAPLPPPVFSHGTRNRNAHGPPTH
jgi:hypothetical protein